MDGTYLVCVAQADRMLCEMAKIPQLHDRVSFVSFSCQMELVAEDLLGRINSVTLASQQVCAASLG